MCIMHSGFLQLRAATRPITAATPAIVEQMAELAARERFKALLPARSSGLRPPPLRVAALGQASGRWKKEFVAVDASGRGADSDTSGRPARWAAGRCSMLATAARAIIGASEDSRIHPAPITINHVG
jgi:hypothetical protein